MDCVRIDQISVDELPLGLSKTDIITAIIRSLNLALGVLTQVTAGRVIGTHGIKQGKPLTTKCRSLRVLVFLIFYSNCKKSPNLVDDGFPKTRPNSQLGCSVHGFQSVSSPVDGYK